MKLIRALRSENGCPWDIKQTPESFHPYILEEYHELVQAINDRNPGEMVDEMGDLVFLCVFTAYMLEQSGIGSVDEIVGRVITKMKRRHPHVFGDAEARDSEQVIDNWNKIKAGEKTIKVRKSVLDGVPRTLPALSRAQRLSQRAGTVGFDWKDPLEVFVKVQEELREFETAVRSGDSEASREELGDLLFVIVNAARHVGANAEAALNETSDKFERRFRHIEEALGSRGKSLEDVELREMDALWDEAKALEQKNRK
jgi:MazG family protein